MFSKITRTIVAGVVSLSMLAGCAPITTASAPHAPARTSQEWKITPVVEAAPIEALNATATPADILDETDITPASRPVAHGVMYPALLGETEASTRSTGSGSAGEFLMGQANSLATQAAQDLLGQFGTARLSVQGIADESRFSGSLDMLFPLYDEGPHLLFTQLGARHSNLYTDAYRTTINTGMGYRHFVEDSFMVGGNVFFDQDITRQHQRLGLGAEFWMDNFKLAANGYFPLTDWKKSPDLTNYLERPATGFDIRAEGFLPSYPALGGKIMYEQYYGDEVGLFGTTTRQRDPSALTLGLTYTPVPAITLGVDHRLGQDDVSSTNLTLNFKYQIGVPLAKQFDPSRVAASRKLDAMRMDLVERNNEIVLEYKKDQPVAAIKLPAALANYPGSVVGFSITLQGMTAGSSIDWSGSAAPFAAPYTPGSGMGYVTLPAYDMAGANTYQLIATAQDATGKRLVSSPMIVTVQPVKIKLTPSLPQAKADGTENVVFTATLLGVQGEPMVSHPVTWSIPPEVNLVSKTDMTDNAGQAIATINSIAATTANVSAVDAFGFEADASTEFTGDPASATVTTLIAAPPSILANNVDTSTLTATVSDAHGNPVGAGVTVTWSGGINTTSMTNASSQATTTAPASSTPGTVNFTAKGAAGDAGKTAGVTYTVDASGAKVDTLVAAPASILANGTDTSTLTATVSDAFGNPVGAGVTVTWSGDVTGTSTTNASSQAVMTAAARTVPGTANVTAKASAGDAGKSASVTYAMDMNGLKVDTLVAAPASILANGTDTSTLTATVSDAFGNPVGAGVTVTWSGGLTGTSTTDASSQAVLTAAARTVPGTANVTAKASAGDAGKTASVTYAMDMNGLKVDTLVAAPASILANGTDTSTLTATVSDAFGNPVGAGVTVTWSGGLTGTSTTAASSQAVMTAAARTVPGTANVTAKASAGDAGKSASVTYAMDMNGLKVDTLVAAPASILANGTDTSTLTATVSDAFGNPVGAGVTVTWSGGLTGTSTTDASSQAVLTAAARTVPGTANVTAKASAGDAGKSASVTYAMDMSGLKVNSLIAAPASIPANGTNTSTLTATVTDAFGNLAGAGLTVTWSGGISTISMTNASSQATATAPASTTVGAVSFTAKASAGDPGKTAIVTYKSVSETAGDSQNGWFFYIEEQAQAPHPIIGSLVIRWNGTVVYSTGAACLPGAFDPCHDQLIAQAPTNINYGGHYYSRGALISRTNPGYAVNYHYYVTRVPH